LSKNGVSTLAGFTSVTAIGTALFLEFDAQGICKCLQRMLCCAIVSLQRDGPIRQRTGNVNERAATLAQVSNCHP
jgi:hypothetical protein